MQLYLNCIMTAHENKILGEGLTYDDVLLVPAFSEVLPREVNIQTKFTRNITINIQYDSFCSTYSLYLLYIFMSKGNSLSLKSTKP